MVNFRHRLSCHGRCSRLSRREDAFHLFKMRFIVCPAFTVRSECINNVPRTIHLTVETTESAALASRPNFRDLGRIKFVVIRKDETNIRPTRISLPLLLRVGDGCSHLFLYVIGGIRQQDRVPHRFAHSLPVQTRQACEFCDSSLRLWKNRILGRIQRIEAPRNLSGNLNMGQLILAHRDQIAFIQQDIRRLEHWIAEMPIDDGVQFQVSNLLFQRWVALEPGRCDQH